jgi:hypothetical protein
LGDEDNWEISINGDLAVITFILAGSRRSKNKTDYKLRQHNTHV